jgi:hypothetical protein
MVVVSSPEALSKAARAAAAARYVFHTKKRL